MKEEIAQALLSAKAVSLSPKEPFTYASGIKSPIYCDNRLLLSIPKERERIIENYISVIKESKIDFDIVAGVATGAIAWGAIVADRLQKPMVYVRPKSKEHGKQNKIEGRLEKGQNVLVIEDLISTGGSSVSAVEAIKEAGGKPVACIAIFTYGFSTSQVGFQYENCPLFTLSDFKTLVQLAAQKNYISDEEKQSVLKWHANPEMWKP